VTSHPLKRSQNPVELYRIERYAFAAKIRLTRVVLGCSRHELGFRVGLTQREIYKLEQGATEPRRRTIQAFERIWREQNIEFEEIERRLHQRGYLSGGD
jgi:predicted transcriptional regulator